MGTLPHDCFGGFCLNCGEIACIEKNSRLRHESDLLLRAKVKVK